MGKDAEFFRNFLDMLAHQYTFSYEFGDLQAREMGRI
jgi:hypothetical protein